MSRKVVVEFDTEEAAADFLHWMEVAGFLNRANDSTEKGQLDMPDFKRRKRKKK